MKCFKVNPPLGEYAAVLYFSPLKKGKSWSRKEISPPFQAEGGKISPKFKRKYGNLESKWAPFERWESQLFNFTFVTIHIIFNVKKICNYKFHKILGWKSPPPTDPKGENFLSLGGGGGYNIDMQANAVSFVLS